MFYCHPKTAPHTADPKKLNRKGVSFEQLWVRPFENSRCKTVDEFEIAMGKTF